MVFQCQVEVDIWLMCRAAPACVGAVTGVT